MSSLNKKQKNNNDDNNNDEVPKGLIDLFGKDPIIKNLNDLMGKGIRTFLVEVKIRFKSHREGRNQRWNYGRDVF